MVADRSAQPQSLRCRSNEPQLDPAPAVGLDRLGIRWPWTWRTDDPLEPVTADPAGHRTHGGGIEVGGIGHPFDPGQPRAQGPSISPRGGRNRGRLRKFRYPGPILPRSHHPSLVAAPGLFILVGCLTERKPVLVRAVQGARAEAPLEAGAMGFEDNVMS